MVIFVDIEVSNKATGLRISMIKEDGTILPFNKNNLTRFDFKLFGAKLSSNFLARNFLYSEVIPSTQAIISDAIDSGGLDGLCCLALTQTKGRGRGCNQWISDLGCLMFSFLLRDITGSNVLYLQYLSALVMVESIKEIYGKDIPIFVKWPNDVYCKSSTGRFQKIGGMLIQNNILGSCNLSNVVIGIGINITNKLPNMTCLADILNELDRSGITSPELILSTFFNNFELCLADFKATGFQRYFDRYYSTWMHSKERIVINDNGSTKSAVVMGLDKNGSLCAIDDSGMIHSLTPDGNSLDIMSGLVSSRIKSPLDSS